MGEGLREGQGTEGGVRDGGRVGEGWGGTEGGEGGDSNCRQF